MNEKLEKFKVDIQGKRVAVLGIGISNTPLIKYLAKLGVSVTAFDQADRTALAPTLESLKGLDVEYCLGENYLDKLIGFDVIFKTPKVRFDIPPLLKEAEAGALITSEMEVFCNLCPARIFGVTGSDGKTTTTTLIYEILKNHGYKCWLGGNIGTPLLDRIDEIGEDDMVVLELSSFQLHTMHNRIHTAVVTNLSPNHLDVHKSMQEYADAKKNIFLYQHKNDTVVLNYDNEITKSFASEAPGRVILFSRTNAIDDGMTVENGRIVYKRAGEEIEIMDVDDIFLPGAHNVENYLAAASATIDFVSPEDIKYVARTFKGVEHRVEFVREVNGRKFYNDSIGSSPTRTIASINSFKEKVVLITGGYDKHIPYDELGEAILDKVKAVVLMGQTGPKIEQAINSAMEKRNIAAQIPIYHVSSMEEAVKCAYEHSEENDIIILSPASASFDMFKNFEERGRVFKEAVNRLQ